MELVWEKDKNVHLPVGAELGSEIFMTAINGLEWFSPALYEKYMMPQGKRLFDWGHERNSLIGMWKQDQQAAIIPLFHRCGV